MEFPTLVYKCPGEHHAHDGATYKYLPVADKEAFDARIADGWHESLVDAVDALNKPKESAPIPDDDKAPTREELEIKAKELNIKFDGRTTDAKLLKLINESL